MKVYRPILVVLTLLVATLISSTLLGSWTEPQVQSQLNLYQSDLLLHAAEWEGLGQKAQPDAPSLRTSFLGENPVKDALKNYESVRTSAQQDLERLKRSDRTLTPEIGLEVDSGSTPVPRSLLETRGLLIDEIDLRLGLLYSRAKEDRKALQTWTRLANAPKAKGSLPGRVSAANVLIGLWSKPPQILPNAESILNRNLKGWFRFQGLSTLYHLQQRQDAILNLEIAEQQTARSAFLRLLVVGIMPVFGSILGIGILLLWGIRAALSRPQSALQNPEPSNSVPSTITEAQPLAASLQPPNSGTAALGDLTFADTVPWPKETIWQVMVLWFTAFFGVSYLFVQIMPLLGLKPETFSGRFQAYFALFNYGCLMAAGFGILQLSLRPFIPNVLRWLRLRLSGNWFVWGLGGYFVALPLVLIVSVLNQKLLQDQGGGNPILEIILQSRDTLTITLLWSLVAICAPLFEETLFRGFFLTSLTRYLPTGQAIALSGVLFATAHLNLGDLLPLTVLGMLLGLVYVRSRNLLASILLHSLWNSGSFIGLLILGSSSS
jgi:hypothetical protein